MTNYIRRILSISIVGIMLITGTSREANAQDITVSYQTFYDNLAPYGQWIYDPEYGNVWVPNEDGNFRPYGSRGHWVMTEYGNTWVSEDPWGWAVYHYGRWTYNSYYGWVWLPGYEWAPAWVSWRFGGGYAGWAPMGPNINIGSSYYAPVSWWVFVGPQNMYEPNCIRYWYGPSYNPGYIRQTTIINNYYVDNSTRVRYNYGPRAEVIQQFTRQPVQVYRVSQLNRPGAPNVGRNSVSIYRPGVNRGSVSESRPRNVMQAPRGVGRAQAVPAGEGRQPAFRQDVQRRQSEERGGGRDQNSGGDRNGRFDDRTDNRGQRDNQPGRTDTRTQTDRQNTRTQTSDPNSNNGRPQPGRFDNQPDRQNTRTQPTNPNPDNGRPQPGRFDNKSDRQNARTQPETRTQPVAPTRQNTRTQPVQPESRPQPGRSETPSESRPPAPQPPRYDTRMDRRTQSQPQPQSQPGRDTRRTETRPQSQPQSNPQQGSGQRGGGRR
jgi:hypothetical protein